ncbi:MAG TPA: outer membrane beta-barrel protein [Longimicrobium sp.]|nr:outer membrane beta-barrel protein [Longimicrobium sp.]
MRRFLLLAAATLAAAPLQAQSGFALKGHYLYNENTARDSDRNVPNEDGFSIGAEVVLPFSVGVGISAYTNGRAREADFESRSFGVLAEANYFLDLPLLPVTPYAGIHAGLGRYTSNDLSDADPEIEDDRTQLGFQLGLRFQLTSLIGLDAQYRRVSDSASSDQSPDLDRNQVLVGVTLF